jgi:hypothetical protein
VFFAADDAEYAEAERKRRGWLIILIRCRWKNRELALPGRQHKEKHRADFFINQEAVFALILFSSSGIVHGVDLLLKHE